MSFTVNQTVFNTILDMDDNVTIQSYSHKYTVLYDSSSLKKLIHENYNENDFILIDNNVNNLFLNGTSFEYVAGNPAF